ncbi:hypothetical protein [Streptomyces nigra]|uniref:hypothetical protein n=1 Tax=Streptomyces nigra TaxID=1827580 RepID=UPI0035D661DA
MIDIGVGKGSVGRGGRSTWAGTAAAALPLYLTMIAASAGALVDTALLGNHTTAALAAFAVTLAVFSPAGLSALWAALALADFFQAAGKAYSFHRHSGCVGTPSAAHPKVISDR